MPLVLYAYCTAIHSSTHISPFQLMFGRSPAVTPFQCPYKFDTTTYASHLKAKLQAIQNFVHTNLTKCAEQQKRQYDRHTLPRSFNPSDPVWLSVPTVKKLQQHWDEKWTVSKVKGPCNLELTDGHQSKVVHVNRVWHRIQPGQVKGHTTTEQQPLQWNPPEFHHLLISEAPIDDIQRCFPLCDRHPPDRLRF